MSKDAKIYISGPMSGLHREVYLRKFREAEKELRGLGFRRIVNPINVWACRWPWLYRIIGYRLTLWYDIQLLKRCDAIYLLTNWELSKGACREFDVACNYDLDLYKQNGEFIERIRHRV